MLECLSDFLTGAGPKGGLGPLACALLAAPDAERLGLSRSVLDGLLNRLRSEGLAEAGQREAIPGLLAYATASARQLGPPAAA